MVVQGFPPESPLVGSARGVSLGSSIVTGKELFYFLRKYSDLLFLFNPRLNHNSSRIIQTHLPFLNMVNATHSLWDTPQTHRFFSSCEIEDIESNETKQTHMHQQQNDNLRAFAKVVLFGISKVKPLLKYDKKHTELATKNKHPQHQNW